jgi:integrase
VRLDELPQSFQDELQAHLAWLGGADLFCDRPPPTVCKPSTIDLRRDNVRLAASALVASGVEPASIGSLADLVTRDRVKTILLFYIEKAERQVTAFTRGLATALLSIAEHWVRVSPEELADLKSLRRRLGNTALGLTPKNQATLRELSAPAVRHRLLALPQMLLQQAGSNRPTPERAAVTAQLAVAIDILIHAPMRMQNLIGLQLGEHLARPGGPRGLWHIVLPRHEVKNGEPLEYELPSATTRLVDVYLRQFRPALAPGASRQLFIVAGGAPKSQTTLAQQIKGAILEHVGVAMTPHQFRHFAAKLMLEHSPGAHGATSHLLGHRNLKTTVAFYSGLDSLSAGRQFDAILQREQARAVPPRRRRARVRPLARPVGAS